MLHEVIQGLIVGWVVDRDLNVGDPRVWRAALQSLVNTAGAAQVFLGVVEEMNDRKGLVGQQSKERTIPCRGLTATVGIVATDKGEKHPLPAAGSAGLRFAGAHSRNPPVKSAAIHLTRVVG